MGRRPGQKRQRPPAAPAAQHLCRCQARRHRAALQLDQDQLVPCTGGIPLQQSVRPRQLFHDAAVCPAGKVADAAPLHSRPQPAVRAANSDMKYHPGCILLSARHDKTRGLCPKGRGPVRHDRILSSRWRRTCLPASCARPRSGEEPALHTPDDDTRSARPADPHSARRAGWERCR